MIKLLNKKLNSMEMFEGKPLLRLTINGEEDGVNIISLVEFPAVERNFIQLSREVKLSLNEEKRELLGVALIPDFPIYRRDEQGEYYITFNAESIRKIAIDFYKKLNVNMADMEHTHDMEDGITYFQSMILDKENGICPTAFKDLPDGTWIVGCKVENDKVWEAVKSGEVKGFSIDGYFHAEPEKQEEKPEEKSTIDSLDDLFDWLENLK